MRNKVAGNMLHLLAAALLALSFGVAAERPLSLRSPAGRPVGKRENSKTGRFEGALATRSDRYRRAFNSPDWPAAFSPLRGYPAESFLVESDMVLSLSQFRSLYGSNGTRHKRKTYRTVVPWTNGTVPYVISPWDFTGNERAGIHQAMEEWEEKTCVNFRPALSSDVNKIMLKNGQGCNSQLGMVGGSQAVNLETPGCRFKGLYLHELGHALGLLHEHQLPYRDNQVEIIMSNVKPVWRQWFDKYNTAEVESFGIPYDVSSIMHYGSTAFSFDGKSETIRTKDRSRQSQIIDVHLNELAFSDVKAVNFLYRCNASCPTTVVCSGGGYVGKSCQCICPDGTSSCQTYPRVAPTVSPECVNLAAESSCLSWAQGRECVLNPVWMATNCRKACKKCGLLATAPILPPKECTNIAGDADCAGFARSGECFTSAAWMFVNCTAACGMCTQRAGGEECLDVFPDSAQCREWRDAGLCDYYPTWMWANCRRTCNVCGSKPTGCSNRLPDAECYGEASTGECGGARAEFMKTSCSKACGKCGPCYNELPSDAACNDLATRGECSNSYEWMDKNCKKACKFCGSVAVTSGQRRPCVDLNDECPTWARRGECITNSAWMIPNCQSSCGRCNCINTHTDERKCDEWASSGECSANPAWMIDNCQKSCGACTNIAPSPEKCYNVHPSESSCRQWASEGECEVNPRWMVPNCRKACTKCSPPTGVTTGTTAIARATAARTTARQTPTTSRTTTRIALATTTRSAVSSTTAGCTDVYGESRCRSWANGDQCRLNPSFMNRNCALACGRCTASATTASTTTFRATAATTQDFGSGTCSNRHSSDADCAAWARGGQCSTNAMWMSYKCARACNTCSPVCDDAYADRCQSWSRQGQCQQNSMWMTYYCYKSCFCSSDNTPPAGNGATTGRNPVMPSTQTKPLTTPASPDATQVWIEDEEDGLCADNDASCPAWAQAGQCEAHREFARSRCPLSCEFCTPGACTDSHENCPMWADSGKCYLFRYTQKTCPLSCKICSIPDWQP